MKITVIGITDHPNPWFPPEVGDIIRQGRVFSGGRRHREIVAGLLPAVAQWIDITVPLAAVFERYASLPPTATPLIVFASGDPLFFGFASTLLRRFPDAELTVFPTFNSLQLLAHRLLMPYHDMRIVSLTGRPWQELDRALIERAPKVGVLTDREHTPAAIAQRLIEYGYTYYNIYIGEHLGHPGRERVTSLTLEQAAATDFLQPNCLILCATEDHRSASAPAPDGGRQPWTRPFGIPESAFALLDGREKMITKMPIRLLTLQALDLPRRHVLWDVGFCTGSVSIEARLQFPHLRVEAFEVRSECEAIIRQNARRFGVPGIGVHIGDFCQADVETLPPPDAVFVGGHGGRLKDVMAKALRHLAPEGVIVMNSVTAPRVPTDSHRLWDDACRALGLCQEPPLRIVVDNHHPIEILKCRK